MKKGLRSLIVLALIVSLGTGSVLLAFPKKAEANVLECLSGILYGKVKGKGEVAKAGFSGFGQTVPVLDSVVKAMVKANANINTDTLGNTQGSTITRCIVEPMVTIMVRSLLTTFTAQTISWINGGFKGSPLYVTNPQGFLTDIADQSLGQFINGLGPIGQILCSPFDLQLRLSLNLQFGTAPYYQEIGCRLTDIQQNVQRAFTGGSFGANGWDNWLQLNAYPQNNPYGAFIKASESLSTTIGNRQFINLKQLDWGKGFLSSTDPDTGKVSTPGSLIEDQLSKTLGVDVERVGLAKDLDAILGALVNQLINQVMGPGGLLGASQRPSGGQRPTLGGQLPTLGGQTPTLGGQSPVERALGTSPASIIAANEATQRLPDGLYVETGVRATPFLGPTATDEFGKPTGPSGTAFCAAFKKNIYSADKSTTAGVLTNASLIFVKVLGTGADIRTKKNGAPPQWNLADYNRVATFCQSVNITTPIADTARDFNDQIKGETAPEEEPSSQKPAMRQITLASPDTATLNQSDVYQHQQSGGPRNAAIPSGWSDTRGDNNDEDWWTASLIKPDVVETLKIRSYPGYGGNIGEVTLANLPAAKAGGLVRPSDFAGYEVFRSKGNLSINLSAAKQTGTVDDFTINFNPPINFNALLINGLLPNHYLILAEVTMYRPATATANQNPGGPAGTGVSFSPAEQESKPTDASCTYYNTSCKVFSSTFKMTANQSQTGLKARVKFLGTKADSSTQNLQFSTVFAPDSLKINELPVDVQQNSVIFNNNFKVDAGQTQDYRITARIADNPIFTSTVTYLSYKMVMEFFKTVNNAEQIVGSETTMFKIQ